MEAAAVLQSYLDGLAAAILRDDWDTYRDGISLPCAIVTHDESKIIATEEELRVGYETFRDTLRTQRVTDYIRLVDQAHHLDVDLISGSYVSHIIAGGQRVLPPYRSVMVLRLTDNRWRAASVTNGLANSRWPLIRLELPETPEGQM